MNKKRSFQIRLQERIARRIDIIATETKRSKNAVIELVLETVFNSKELTENIMNAKEVSFPEIEEPGKGDSHE